MKKKYPEAYARIRRLRQALIKRPTICMERCELLTQVYRKTEGEPEIRRRAKALRRVMEQMTIFIQSDELIVGRSTSKVRGALPTPELNASWYLDELDRFSQRDVDKLEPLTTEDRQKLTDAVLYWREQSVAFRLDKTLTSAMRELPGTVIGGPAYSINNQYHGHLAPDYEEFLRKGARGILAEINEKKAVLQEGSLEDLHKREFYEAAAMGLESVMLLAERYAQLALQMAEAETDTHRRKELEKIATICRRVPAEPAYSFWEAIQSITFLYFAIMIESPGPGTGFSRIDQYLYPYYKADREAGILSEEEAYLLIGMLYLKCSETVFPYNEATASAFAGFATDSNIMLGGVDAQGADAVNELSYLCLEAELAVALNAEDIVIRVTSQTSDAFLQRACQIAKAMNGKLKFVGDQIIIRQLLHDGHTVEEARDYAITGCNSPTIPGRSLDCPGGVINVALLLELALYNGYSSVLEKQIGAATGDAVKFISYEQLWEAFCAQVRHFIPLCHGLTNLDKELMAYYMPAPFLSTLYPCCLEKGEDIIRGGTAPELSYAMSYAGVINVGDALAAVKSLVYEQEKITMARMLQALQHNFEGYEDVLYLIGKVPKFGNGEPYVDRIVDQIFTMLGEEVEKIPGFAGATSTAAASCITTSVPLGTIVGALPDGRKRHLPLAEGGISPYQGRNVSGPTATLRSVSGLNHMALRNGSVLNMRFDPQALATEENLQKFSKMLRTYFDNGGFLVQFNIVSTETLRDAQCHPECYQDLLVRVATYAAKFVELSPTLQDDIINRTAFYGC